MPGFCRAFSQYGYSCNKGIVSFTSSDKNQKKWGKFLGSRQRELKREWLYETDHFLEFDNTFDKSMKYFSTHYYQQKNREQNAPVQ